MLLVCFWNCPTSSGWRGPASEDLETIVALIVLFRYFQDTPASPFSQAFVERPDPLAASVDYDFKGYVETCLILDFTGVPYHCVEEASQEDMETSESEINEDGSDDTGDSESDVADEAEPRKDLFEEGVYQSLVRDNLQAFVRNGFRNQKEILDTIDRHRCKIVEGLEEEPHEFLTAHIVPDITRYFLSSQAKDSRHQGGHPNIGTRLDMFDILSRLEKKSLTFWQDLARAWLLERPMVEVRMIPDVKMSEEISQREIQDQNQRAKKLGKKGLQKLQRELDAALEENKVFVPDELVKKMPRVPDASKCARLNAVTKVIDPPISQVAPLFQKIQIVQTDTVFTQFRLALNTSSIPLELRPYLVIFQELLFQTHVEYPCNGSTIKLDYRDVSTEVARLFISHESSVGLGNDVWSSSWLGEVFMVHVNSEEKNWEAAFRLLCRILLFSVFEKDRIICIATNLVNEITEVKRDGASMCMALATRIAFSGRQSQGCNDLEISIFRQEAFMKNVIKKCKMGQDAQVIQDLQTLQRCLLNSTSEGPGFAQISVPSSFTNISAILDIWDTELKAYRDIYRIQVSKSLSQIVTPFPFPRVPFTRSDVDERFPSDIVVPISGLGASFLFQIVQCDVMMPHPDYYALLLLIEILSRCEGALYSAIRGQGYAYGAGLNLFLWTGQLCFELMDASEPYKGLLAFYDILEKLKTDDGFEDLCSDFEMETARASLAYRFVSERATSAGIISQALRSQLKVAYYNLINIFRESNLRKNCKSCTR